MRILARTFVLTVALLATNNVLAWGAAGHQSSGAIADRLIAGTPAERQVRKILGSTLMTASVWADCAKGVRKSNGSFQYVDAGKFAECAIFEKSASSRALMVSYVRRNWSNCSPGKGEDPCHKQYHYTDVATGHDAYAVGLVGTSDHDIVGAISAAVAVLRDESVPSPFDLATKKEALRVLAHLVGDVHQPLHVVSVYLDGHSRPIDPDAGTFSHDMETRGGNSLLRGSQNLHGDWDGIVIALTADRLVDNAIEEARAIPLTSGDPSEWASQWATDTIRAGERAFEGISYTPGAKKNTWNITLPTGYSKVRQSIQREQLIKAGARLAQLLTTIWP